MTADPVAGWRLGREDVRPILLIVLLPLLVAAPQLLGILKADPMLYLGKMTIELTPGILGGLPYIDPNNGVTTQALGRHAAWQWLQGSVPWWNHYSGIGLPLAAEYQPGAFFPLTFLLLLPYGMAWHHVALQILSGIGTYGLLRQMGVNRTAAMAGGLLYAFNGTLAWFAHAPATPVPFLPWMLWGIERIAGAARAARPGGWGLLAAAMAFSLLASFPETAYLSGLLALAWTVVRGIQLPNPMRRGYALRVALGGTVGIALAAPQVYAFLEYLRHADIGEHGNRFAHEAMGMPALIPSIIAPYFFGPIFAYSSGTEQWLFHYWGALGGYVTLALVVAAVAGFWSRRDAIGWLLFAWCVLAIARSFGFPFASTLWNLIPGVSLAAFYRYAPPSWELALVLLAARGVDVWLRGTIPPRAPMIAAAAAVALGGVTLAGILGMKVLPLIRDADPLRNWAAAASLAALATAITAVVLIGRGPRGARAVAGLLIVEAVVMFAIPTLSNPSSGRIDIPAIHFLRDHLGFQRFYTLGPIQPNYGAFFRIASINYNYLPNSRRWHRWVRDNLDRQADSAVFDGLRGGEVSQLAELRRNRTAYMELGVKFVVVPAGLDPFSGGEPARKVYGDAIVDIYELAGWKPYFESVAGRCTLDATQRSAVAAQCSSPDRLVRRELFHPGWSASLAGQDIPILEHLGLYQSVELPAGRSEVRFDYAPPYVGWAWLASLAGALAFAAAGRSGWLQDGRSGPVAQAQDPRGHAGSESQQHRDGRRQV